MFCGKEKGISGRNCLPPFKNKDKFEQQACSHMYSQMFPSQKLALKALTTVWASPDRALTPCTVIVNTRSVISNWSGTVHLYYCDDVVGYS